MIGIYQTTRPENVEKEMSLLIDWYNKQRVDILILAVFHAKYESIYPFQDDDVIIRTKLEKPSKIKGWH